MKEAHGIVVTDVAFVPESQRGRELLAGNEAALLSVAVDSRCKLHLLPGRRRWLSSCPAVRSGAAQPVLQAQEAAGPPGTPLRPCSPLQAPSPSGCCCCSVPG